MNNWMYFLLGIITTSSLSILYFVILIYANLNKQIDKNIYCKKGVKYGVFRFR